MSKGLNSYSHGANWSRLKPLKDSVIQLNDYKVSKEDEITVDVQRGRFTLAGVEHLPDEWQINEGSSKEHWLDVRLQISAVLFDDAVSVDPNIRDGIPVFRDTRITLSQVLIEIADGESINGFAEEYDVDVAVLKKFFEGLAIHLDRSFVK